MNTNTNPNGGNTMIVRPLYNTTRGDCFDGFTANSALVPSPNFAQVAALSADIAAEEAFVFFNRDNRPNGKTERSVSVGDVIQVFHSQGRVEFFAIERTGIKQVTRLAVIKALRAAGTPGYSPFADELPVAGVALPVATRIADNPWTVETAEAEAIKSGHAATDWLGRDNTYATRSRGCICADLGATGPGQQHTLCRSHD